MNYGHIGAIVADAVLQANNKYAVNVRPRIRRIREEYSDFETTTAVLGLLVDLPATKFLSWKGEDRAKRFLQILHLFRSESIDTEDNLREWLKADSSLKKLRSIYGIGPKTADYFRILVGLQTSAIDRHLKNFVSLAGCQPGTYGNAQALIHAAADILSVSYSIFDHSIWKFMSERVPKVRESECFNGA